MMEFIKNNISFLKEKFCVIAGSLFGVLSILLSFLSWEELGIISKCQRFCIMGAIILVAAIVSVVWLCAKRKNDLWEQGEKCIRAIYGDILKIASNQKQEKIVVIPVNTTFDTIVGGRLVSPNSVHGRWIKKFCTAGHTVNEIDQMIQDNLAARNVSMCCVQELNEKPEGKRERYPQGTVAVIDDGKTHYYLLVLAHYDNNLNAQCSKTELLGVINSLIDFYDKNGQGMPIYIPLMGSGLSRAGVTPAESLQIISDLLKLNRSKVHGEANIVVYSKVRNQVSIFDL